MHTINNTVDTYRNNEQVFAIITTVRVSTGQTLRNHIYEYIPSKYEYLHFISAKIRHRKTNIRPRATLRHPRFLIVQECD